MLPVSPVACYFAGLTAPRQVVALESHFDHHANALISALRESADPMMYVTQLPEASTHPKYMSLKVKREVVQIRSVQLTA